MNRSQIIGQGGRWGRWASALLQVLALGGCGGRELSPFSEGTVAVQTVPFAAPAAVVGKVAAVADSLDDVGVFGSLGASLWQSGIEVGSDPAVTSWRAAAVVPALDLPESWLLGVARLGQVYRLRSRVALEEVTARFALSGRPVREVVALSPTQTAFSLGDQVAVADAQNVAFFDIAARGLAGASGRLAAFDETGVIELDFQSAQGVTMQRLPLADVIAVAFDLSAEQSLVAATAEALYVEQNGTLVQAYRAPAGTAITGLAGSGGGVWVAIGSELALFRGAQLLHGPVGKLPEGVRLVGSPSGDVWLLGGPQLVRLGERTAGGADENRWRRTMLPIFQRLCRMCHLPGGSANLDLSTYDKWTQRREHIRQRLVDQLPTPMPPATIGKLTTDELLAVQRWVGGAPAN